METILSLIIGLAAWLLLAIPAAAIICGGRREIEDDIDIPTEQRMDEVMRAVWALVHSAPNYDGRDRDVKMAVEAAIERAVAEERERIAAWLATQRNDTPATGSEFAAALRAQS